MKQKEKEVVVRGMKHSEELGCAIPSHWDVKALGEVAEIISGGTPTSNEEKYWNGTILWCTPTDITKNNHKYIYKTEKTITELGLQNSSAQLLPIGTILLCTRATIGIASITKTIITTNQGFKNIIVNNNNNKEYIYYWSQQKKVKNLFIVLSNGTTFLELSKYNLSMIPLPLPPVEEQEAIARVLGSADAVLDALAEQHAKAEALKTMLMQQLLSGTRSALDGAPMPMKHSEELGCAIAAHWDVKALGDVADVVRGGSPRPIEKYISKDNEGLNWLKIGDVLQNSKYITSTKQKIIKEGLSKTRKVKKGDLILSNSMSFGRPYIMKIDACIHDGWLSIYNFQANIKTHFFYYILTFTTSYKYFISTASGTTVKNLNKDIVKTLPLPLPPVEEQEAIARVLSSADAVLDALAEQHAKAEALKTMLMQQLLSGTCSALP